MTTAISRSTFLRMALGAAAIGLLPGRARAAAADGLSGTYRYAGGARQRAALERAIDTATADLSFIVRPIARSRIMSALDPRPNVALYFSGDRFTLVTPGIPTLRGRLDGTPFAWKNQEGATITVRATLHDQTLRLRYRGDGGDTICHYHFTPDGGLQIRTRVEHDQLPATLRYELSYRQP